jgi:hypothetical protein
VWAVDGLSQGLGVVDVGGRGYAYVVLATIIYLALSLAKALLLEYALGELVA